MRSVWLHLLFSSASLCLASGSHPLPDAFKTGGGSSWVKTTSGTIEGHIAPNKPSVIEFLGIRYARATTGSLRFSPPYPSNSTRYFNASDYSPDCPANISPILDYPGLTAHGSSILQKFLFQNTNHTQSEDCMTVNIWAPASRRLKGLKPVLVFHHGGRFQIPGSNSPFYNGAYLASAEDLVVVTFNKREAFLGYPGVTPNLGLLDFRLVVEWVRDNIRGFGGGPRKITLWGHSSGGVSVDAYAYAYPHDPIAQGLIMDSGMVFNLTSTWPGEQAEYFKNASNAAGCPTTSTEAALDCLRSLPVSQILDATRQVPGTHRYQGVNLSPFRPTIDNITILANYTSLAKHASFARIPILTGVNNHESGFYRVTASAANITMTESGWDAWEAYTSYCPSLYEAYQRRRHGVKAWVYRYFGEWKNLELYEGSGAYHGTELDMVFGTAEDIAGRVGSNTDEEDRTMRYMMRAWGAFARDPWRGLEREMGWAAFEPRRATLVRLGHKAAPGGASFVKPSVYGQYCPPLSDPMPNYGEHPTR